MGRWCSLLAAALCLAGAGAGCTTIQAGRSFADSGPDLDETGKRASLADTKRSPRRPSAAPDGSASSDVDSGSSRPGSRGHSPQVAALIDRELRDATPAERAALLKTLRDLPDESVRHILTERRRGLQLAERQRAGEGTSPAKTAGPTISPKAQPAVAELSLVDESPAVTRPPRSSALGLGTVSAWDQSATARRAAPPLDEADLAVQLTSAEGLSSPATNETAERPASGSGVRPAFSEGYSPHGHSAGHRPTAPLEAPSPQPAKGTSPVAPAGPSGGNPLLGYLIPQRFRGGPVSAPKPAAAPPAGGVQTASVALGMPREVAPVSAPAVEPAVRPAGDVLDELIAAVESELIPPPGPNDDEQKRTYVEQQVYLRMLYLMSGHQERALQAIPGIDPVDQEFWQQTFWGLANYFDAEALPTNTERVTQTIAQMNKAIVRLQEKAGLELQNVNFCRKISLFGTYDKYPRDEFRPGQEVLLYAELANIRSEPAADGKYRTCLKSTLEIHRYGAEGEPVDRIEFPEQVDLCRSHRRDYFNSYKYTLPTHLTLGPHVLKLTVEDQLSRRTATYSLNFMVK